MILVGKKSEIRGYEYHKVVEKVTESGYECAIIRVMDTYSGMIKKKDGSFHCETQMVNIHAFRRDQHSKAHQAAKWFMINTLNLDISLGAI